MDDLIERLNRWMRTHRPGYHSGLRPGLDRAQVDEFERSLGFRMPEDLKALYAWRDGQDPACEDAFQGYETFMGVESVRSARGVMNDLLAHGEFDETWWDPRWMPFLEDRGGDYTCVDLGGSFAGQVGQVFSFRHDDEDRTVLYPSLRAWLGTFVASLEAGFWQEQEVGFLPRDLGEWDAFAERMNPGYPIRAEANIISLPGQRSGRLTALRRFLREIRRRAHRPAHR